MGVYDFNTTAYDINEIIRQLKHELQSIVVNSQSNITEIKQKISADEALLDRLKKEVDELPDFTEQYNELRVELDKLKVVLDEISKHPIILDNIDVSGSGKLYTEVQKINHQLIYANHAVHDASGRNIIDTYATKDEIAGIDSSLSNKKDRQAELTFDGSAVKTVKKITQNANGELDVEFIDIAGGGSGGSQIEIESPDNSIAVSNETVGSVEKYELSVNTDVVATKESVDEVKTGLNNLTGAVDNHAVQIGRIQEDINGIDSSLSNKKDKQTELTFGGSSIKTVKKITQNVNGELDVEFEDIDYPDYSISSSDGSINVSTSEGVTDLTLPGDVVRDSSYVHVEGAIEVPLTDGIASAGVSTKYAREDHVHPSDTSREDIANKTTVVLGTSDSKYPTDKAVAEFVNSSIATNTANYISNNGEPFTSVEQLNAYTGAVTNNDYAFVTGIDSEGNAYYDRYKAVVNDSSVTWSLEYRLNNSSFTAAQWSAINSGITSVLVAKIHEHGNKAVLDGITSDDVVSWNSKMDRQTVGSATEPVYLENGMAKVATGVATKDELNTKQNSLTAGENITIDGDTISSNQVFVAAYGTTTYKEIKDAYDAGKICLCKNVKLIGTLYAINDSVIRFQYTKPDQGCIVSYSVSNNNIWTYNELGIQSKLTFDATPAEGSSNPVTSDGIKTAIGAVNDAVVDLSQSVGDVKDDLNNLAATVGSNATQIGQLQTDVESIESSLTNKKDRQSELNFAGSAVKTVKSITQDANGVINVEYENIDFVRGDSNVEIKSEDNSVNVVESTDSQTNTKTYDLSVADSIKSKIKDITITNDTLVIIGD